MAIKTKLSRITCVFMAALTVSSTVQAVDLTVKGRIVPPACTASMDGGGVLDWGDISHDRLHATAMSTLDQKPASIQIRCNSDTSVVLKVEALDFNATPGDQDVGGFHVDPVRLFGIGTAPNGAKLGNFILLHNTATYDNRVATAYGFGRQNHRTFRAENFGGINAVETSVEEYTIMDNDNPDVPAKAQQFTYTWMVEPQLNRKDLIPSTDVVPFEGTARITVAYF